MLRSSSACRKGAHASDAADDADSNDGDEAVGQVPNTAAAEQRTKPAAKNASSVTITIAALWKCTCGHTNRRCPSPRPRDSVQ